MVRVAAARRAGKVNVETATIRVNEFGAGVIATGETDPDTFDNIYHDEGDVLTVPLETAQAHHANRLVSIVREPQPEAAALEGDIAVIERRGPGRPRKDA